jgi:ubiquinone/menaquinone biosynthesis C-methylase UbiE
VLTDVLHWLVKHPVVYDAVQSAVGARGFERALKRELAALQLSGSVLDVGGGTGAWRRLFPPELRHVCLDLDPIKLRGFKHKYADGVALLADATAMPFADQAFEAVWCVFVAHHLDDVALARMIDEAARVLKPGGSLLFADALFVPRRLPGRLLWRYDRGRHPRALAQHRAALGRRFHIVTERRFAAMHEYVLLIARKLDGAAPGA